MRVALCITELEIGGAERMLVALAKRLDRERITPIVYSLGPRPVGSSAWLADQLDAAGIETHHLDARGARDFPRTLHHLTHLFRQTRPDVVQTFLFHANLLGAWAARRAGCRHIVGGIRVAERERAWHRWLARATGGWFERQVCVSQAVADFSAHVTKLDPAKLLVIANGVDIEQLQQAAPLDLATIDMAAGRRALVVVGRLEYQKGIDWLLDLMPAIFARHPTHDLLIVGTGPLVGRLTAQAQRLGIAERVRFLGLRNDVPRILAASDLVLIPSRWEGMSNVLLEAMALGRPVVATDVEGAREVLGPGCGSQLVAGGDTQVFMEKVLALIGSPESAVLLGQRNQDRVREPFSLAAMVHAYESLYESLG